MHRSRIVLDGVDRIILANLQADERQHLRNAIHPRLQRRDENLNEQLVPLYDPSGRLFLASEDPTPLDTDADARQLAMFMRYGIHTINEVRALENLPPVPGGETPRMQMQNVPIMEATDAVNE